MSGSITVHRLVAVTLAGVQVRIDEDVSIPAPGTLGRFMFPLTCRLATCLIGASDALVELLVEHGGVPPSKVRWVYDVVEQRYFAAISRLPAPRFIILMAGRLAEVKGHGDLLVMLAPIRRAGEVTVRIAGNGPLRGRLSALTAALDIDDVVEVLRLRSSPLSLLAEADLLVLPSRKEGFGLTVVEALAEGVPVLATRAGDVPEVVLSGASDAWVERGDAAVMRAAVERVRAFSEEQCRDLGARSRKQPAAHFGPESYVQELRDVHAKIGAASEVR